MSQVNEFSLCYDGEEFIPFDLAYDYLEDESAIYEVEKIYVHYKGFVDSLKEEVWQSDRFYIDGVAPIDSLDLRNFWQSRYDGGELFVKKFELYYGKVNGHIFDSFNDPIMYDLGASTYVNDDNVFVKRSDIDVIARKYGIHKTYTPVKKVDNSTRKSNTDNVGSKEGGVRFVRKKDLINLIDLSKIFALHFDTTNGEACEWIYNKIFKERLSVYDVTRSTIPTLFTPDDGMEAAVEVFNNDWWSNPEKESAVMTGVGVSPEDVAIKKSDVQTFLEISEELVDELSAELKNTYVKNKDSQESSMSQLILLSDAIGGITKVVINVDDRDRLSKEIQDDYLFAAEDERNSFIIEKDTDEKYKVNPVEINQWLNDNIKPLVADSTELLRWKECTGYFNAQSSLNIYESNRKELNTRPRMKEAMDELERGNDEKDSILEKKDNIIAALQAQLSEQEESDSGLQNKTTRNYVGINRQRTDDFKQAVSDGSIDVDNLISA